YLIFMTLYLRNKENKTILEAEYYIKDNKYLEISSAIIVDNYSDFLLENQNRKDEIIGIFSFLSELRGWLWESYFMIGDNTKDEYDNVLKELKGIFEDIATKLDLAFVID